MRVNNIEMCIDYYVHIMDRNIGCEEALFLQFLHAQYSVGLHVSISFLKLKRIEMEA